MSSDIISFKLIKERNKLLRDNVYMSITNSWVKRNKVQEFVPPSDGMDGELASFINSLIDQNSELAGKLEHLDSLMDLAEKTVIEAHKEAEEIKKEAEREANARVASIVARAEESLEEKLSLAEQQAQEIMKAAEEKGSQIITEALKKAEQLRESSQKTEQCQAVKNPWDVPDQLFAEPVGARETKAVAMAEEKPPEPSIPDAAVSTAPTASVEKPVEQPSRGKEEGDTKESIAAYDDIVDLALLPPIALDQMLKLHKHLKKNPRVKVVELKGSLDKGVTIRILVQAHTPLLSTLASLPEVEKVSDEPIEVGKISSAHRKGNGPRTRTIAVTMKR